MSGSKSCTRDADIKGGIGNSASGDCLDTHQLHAHPMQKFKCRISPIEI